MAGRPKLSRGALRRLGRAVVRPSALRGRHIEARFDDRFDDTWQGVLPGARRRRKLGIPE